MSNYRVNFYKNILNCEGHSFKCLQREINVNSDSPSGALVLAQQQLQPSLDPDCIEVLHTQQAPDFYHTLDERMHKERLGSQRSTRA